MHCPLGGMNHKSTALWGRRRNADAVTTSRNRSDTSISNGRFTADDYRPPCSMTPRKTVAPECSTSRVAVSRTSRWRSATSRR
jgi:hypothetical protein